MQRFVAYSKTIKKAEILYYSRFLQLRLEWWHQEYTKQPISTIKILYANVDGIFNTSCYETCESRMTSWSAVSPWSLLSALPDVALFVLGSPEAVTVLLSYIILHFNNQSWRNRLTSRVKFFISILAHIRRIVGRLR
jgi:hypothetical protein